MKGFIYFLQGCIIANDIHNAFETFFLSYLEIIFSQLRYLGFVFHCT